MENKKNTILIPIIVVLFGVAIYLDSEDCKSLSDVGDILGGGKLKRLEQENKNLRLQVEILTRELKFLKHNIAKFHQDENKPELKPITHKSDFKPRNNLQTSIMSKTSRKAMWGYRNEPNGYFTKYWNNWKKAYDLRDIDLVVVKLTVDKNGKVLTKNIESSASKVATEAIVKEFDNYRFKSFPKDYDRDVMTFRYTFGKNSFGAGSS